MSLSVSGGIDDIWPGPGFSMTQTFADLPSIGNVSGAAQFHSVVRASGSVSPAYRIANAAENGGKGVLGLTS